MDNEQMKNVRMKPTLNILRCKHRKIFKVCFAIFQRFA